MKTRSRVVVLAMPLMALLLFLVFYQYGYERIGSEMASVRAMEQTKTRTLKKYIATISEKQPLEERLAALKERRKADEVKFIGGETVTISAVALSDIVKGLITSAGGTISSERVDKAGELGKFKVVNVGMDAVFPDIRSLVSVLYSVETRVPYIVVKEMDVRVNDFRDPRQLLVMLRVAALAGGK